MKSLQIHPRFLNFGLMILLLNLMISIFMEHNNLNYTGFNWFLNLTFPVWAAVIGGFPVGLIIYFIPQGQMDPLLKMIRSQVFGIMVISFILFVGYFYKILSIGAMKA